MNITQRIARTHTAENPRYETTLRQIAKWGLANDKEITQALTSAGYKPYARFRDEMRTLISAGYVVKITHPTAGDGYQLTEDGALYLATAYAGMDWVLTRELAS